ncbi:hypothetical protein [Yinghuangia soli]|uniref:Uncharacterized protein n=1 Tax=Yinghuangia soli TaxID=2908204 RepID=A0AA41U687_9ACTN|nr:hypothetical protein [Yinghuangia soli]MCF2530744.1 hypothetical protein [Yinghuangia soli]
MGDRQQTHQDDGDAEAVVFVCAACDSVLTAPLAPLPAVPEPPYYEWWNAEHPGPSPATISAGRYAVETEPYGAPLVVSATPGVEVMPRHGPMSDGQGQMLVSRGPRGNIVVDPADARGLELRHVSAACCGATPYGGMNQACAACGTLVATLCSDCCLPHELHFSAGHVRGVRP